MNHLIPLQQAIEMTTRYRDERSSIVAPAHLNQDILPNSESFDVASVLAVINQPGCVSIRIYYGMSRDLKVHAIIVGVNNMDEDMLTVSGINMVDPPILEEGIRCPQQCPPPSALNT